MPDELHPVAKREEWLCGICGSLMEVLKHKPGAGMVQHKCHQCNVVVEAQRVTGMLKKLPARQETPVGVA